MTDKTPKSEPSISPEVLRRIRQIEIKTRRLVNDSFSGAYHSTFKGRGIEFDAVRPYVPGDDVRDIDWNVTARTGEPYIKTYSEERELTVLIVLDNSASCFFGTRGQQKRTLAAEIGAVLALTATTNNDKTGLLVFSDDIDHYTSPRKGRNHILRLIRDMLIIPAHGQGTNLAEVLKTSQRLLKQRAIIFLISDFLAPADSYQRELRIAARRHDVIAVTLSDPLEHEWMDVGLVGVRDAETDDMTWIDTSLRQWRKDFMDRAQKIHQLRDETLSKSGVDRVNIKTSEDIVSALSAFFRGRSR